jgi:hypothetical protein
MDEPFTYSLKEVAQMLQTSYRRLADECRAEKHEHINDNGRRSMTPAQVQLLVRKRTVKPQKGAGPVNADELDRVRAERRSRRPIRSRRAA